MAARRLATGERLFDILPAEGDVEGYEVRSQRVGEAPERGVLHDPPPPGFVARCPGDGGEVRVSAEVDAMLRRVRTARSGQAGENA